MDELVSMSSILNLWSSILILVGRSSVDLGQSGRHVTKIRVKSGYFPYLAINIVRTYFSKASD